MIKRVLLCFALVVGLYGQTGVKIVDGTSKERIIAPAGVAYNSTLTTLPGSATILTAVTTTVQSIHCANTTSGAVTLTITDNQGSPVTYFPAVSMAGNSVLVVNYGGPGMTFNSGIKWNASATSSINCQIMGVQ